MQEEREAMLSYEFQLAMDRRRDMERAAAHHRLLQHIREGHTTRVGALLIWAGRRLVRLGEGMQPTVYTPQVRAGTGLL